jgi:Predicted integral membrane protein
MPSIIEGYSYDIFISYRQKDNKHDGWVTEFVENLKGELESTFKEEISVYFDINPHDGLLETHSVDKSLEGKLKCLIFIPIISQTYCDPKSFAWQHEFCAFNKMAKEDKFGRDIRLASGNVASRILPIKIHDLDPEDKVLLENELEGVLRCIEFIYKETGVNRPLASNDDPKENLNRTHYRNQVNKVANAVKEIIIAIKKYNQKDGEVPKEVVRTKPERLKNLKPKVIIASFFVLALIMLVVFFIPKILKISKTVEKSIAVLPFFNDGPNDSTTYFMDGVMEEILNNLQSIKDLRVISRTSVEQFRKQTKSIPEIARALGVNYIMEGSGQKSGNTFRLRVQLIRADKESHLWAKSYEQVNPEAKDYFSIQSQIAQAIAAQLEAVITPMEKRLIEKTRTTNLEAYDAYLKGEFYRKIWTQNDLETAMKYYKIALEKDPFYAPAYSGIAYVWMIYTGVGFLSPAEGQPREYAALMTAQKLDSTLAEVHYGLAIYNLWTALDWKNCEAEFQKALKINPNYAAARAYYSQFLSVMKRSDEAMKQIEVALKLDPYDPEIKSVYGLDLVFVHRYNDAITVSREALKIDPNQSLGLMALMFSLHLTGRYNEALESWKRAYYISYPGFIHGFEEGYTKEGYTGALRYEADTLVAQSKTAYVNPMDLAYLYVFSGNKERALDCLERAFEVHDQNRIIVLFPIFDSLRNEPRFQELARKLNVPSKLN